MRSPPYTSFLALAVAGFLTGCAVTPYQSYSGGVGYSEVGLTKTRYEVLYHGPAGMDEATAKNHAITRAAELGKANGMTHFRIAGAGVRDDVSRSAAPELFPRRPWTGEPTRMTEWEWRREQELEASRRALTNTETRAPIVRLVVDYVDEECNTCLSVEDKLKEAAEKGILGK